jgi:hypothetical protein
MQVFIYELDGAYHFNQFVVTDMILILSLRDLIGMLAQRMSTSGKKQDWQSWDALRLFEALHKLYPTKAISRFQPTDTRWAEVGVCVSSIEAPLGNLSIVIYRRFDR